MVILIWMLFGCGIVTFVHRCDIHKGDITHICKCVRLCVVGRGRSKGWDVLGVSSQADVHLLSSCWSLAWMWITSQEKTSNNIPTVNITVSVPGSLTHQKGKYSCCSYDALSCSCFPSFLFHPFANCVLCGTYSEWFCKLVRAVLISHLFSTDRSPFGR